MKSINMKRILALVLCMVLMLSSSIPAMANSAAEEIPAPESTADQGVAAASIEAETTETETQDKEVPAAVENTSDGTETGNTTDTAPVADNSVAGTEDLAGEAAVQEPEVKENAETTETTEPKEESEEEVLSEAAELKQEFVDENGHIVERVTANLPEGAFNAKVSEITMEVSYPEEVVEKHLKDLMTKALPENDFLGDYILYDIKFKVDGVVTESQKPITITFEGSGLHIEDTKKANVFCLDPADPEVKGDKDEIVEITQKSEMLKSLQQAGQSTENIDDYDLSEISVKADKTADKIQLEGRTSSVYGCYVEETSKETVFAKDVDGVTIRVAAEAGSFPMDSDKVTMTAKKVSQERQTEIETQLEAKAEEEGKKVLDFLVYDINLWADGEIIQPQIPVKVTFENTKLEVEDTTETTGFQMDSQDNVNVIEGSIDAETTATLEAEHFTETGIVVMGNIPSQVFYSKLEVGETRKLDGGGNPSEWKVYCEDSKIVQVQSSGNWFEVTGKAPGETTVRLEFWGGILSYIYYITVNEAQGVQVIDDIMNSGLLKAGADSGLQKTIDEAKAEGKSVQYVWYKKVNNGKFEKVEPTKVGDEYSIDEESGEWLNVAYDSGALNSKTKQTSVEYQLHLEIDGEETSTSKAFSVPYWNELQNGSFEEPDIYGEDHYQFANGEYPEMVWRTTGLGSTNNKAGQDIEILNIRETLSPSYSWYGEQKAADGHQFAELNCEASGALYQDVLTIKGEPLNFWYSHRARGTKKTAESEWDRMYVVIVPTSIALAGINNNGDPIDTQDEVNALIANKDRYPGVYVEEQSDNDQVWGSYEGTYTPASYLTRFFFVAGPTASYNPTVGNFLDRVGFSQELPPANEGEFRLQIKKNISGLTKEQFGVLREKLAFKVTAEEGNAPYNGTDIKASVDEWKWTENTDGSYTGVYNLTGKVGSGVSYKYTITETNETMSGYNLTSTVSVNGVQQDIKEDKKSGTAVVKEKSSASFVFKNDYTVPPVPEPDEDNDQEVSNSKYIDYLGDGEANPDTNLTGEEYYRLYLNAAGVPNKEPKPADVIFVLDVSRSVSFSMYGNVEASEGRQQSDKLKDAAKAAVNTLMTGNDNVSVSIIPFHTWVNTSGSNVPLLHESSQDNIINYIENLEYETQVNNNLGGGTNYQEAFEATKDTLDSLEGNGHKKYVVFVSGSKPSVYTESDGTFVKNDSKAAANGVTAAKNMTNHVALNGFYTVSVGPESGKEYLEKEITPQAIAAYSQCLDGTNEESLKSAFSTIAGSITRQIGNVTIEDTLSDYVDFIKGNLGAVVDESSIELKITKKIPGSEKPEELNPKDYTCEIDSLEKKISVNFGKEYFLERDAVYTISFNVKLTDKAYTALPSDTGALETDYPGNETSSNKQGFFSNKSAAVTYSRVTDNKYKEEKKDYDKPVVQPRVSHTVKKIWNGTKADSIKVQLKASVQDGKDVTDNVLPEGMKAEIQLNEKSGWSYTWNNLPYQYYQPNKEALAITYTVEETEISPSGEDRVYETTVTESEDGLTTTITNTEAYNWQIIKKSVSADNLVIKGAEFELKSEANSYTGISNENGVVEWTKSSGSEKIKSKEIEQGEYILSETKAPVGYSLSNEKWTVSIEYKGAKPVITVQGGKEITLTVNTQDKGLYECEFLNTPLYELPSAGSSGIFGYIAGGVLLMLAGVLFLYKNKYREVLEK